mmetsp:Transcript_8094/g.16294  ORF Transcript_8094/g.16294 Transcript_8094/m.16294 type:complete len:96 (-) Transcript_8094:65-352(-)
MKMIFRNGLVSSLHTLYPFGINFFREQSYQNPNMLITPPPPLTGPQGCLAPFFQFGHRSASGVLPMALEMCIPHPLQVALPHERHFVREHIVLNM